MRVREPEYGGISLFLAIALLAVVILCGLLVDIARVSAAKNQTARALDIATLAVLADYEPSLKHEYGLFALNMPVPEADTLREYAELNLGIGDGENALESAITNLLGDTGVRRAKLYNFNIESINLVTAQPLSDTDVLERQILEYMKYRAPAALATGIADFLGQAKNAARMADSAKIKVEIDRKLGQIGTEQQNLRDYLYGDVGTAGVGRSFVRNFNNGGTRGKLAQEVCDLYSDYAALADSVHQATLARAGNPDPVAAQSDRDALIMSHSKLNSAWERLQNEETEAFLRANRNAIGCVTKIMRYSDEIRTLYDKLDESVAKIDAGEVGDAFTGPLAEDTERGKASLPDPAGAAGMINDLNDNIAVISRAIAGMNAVRSKAMTFSPGRPQTSQSEIWGALMPDFSGYHGNITYDYKKAAAGGGFADPREYVDDRVAELLDTKKDGAKDKALKDIGVDASGLPSGEVRPWWATLGKGPAAGFSSGGGIEYDPFDKEDEYTSDTLGGTGGFGDVLADGTETFRNSCYVGEYVLGGFDNAIDEKYRWAGVAPPDKAAFFDAEVEYVLHGNDRQSMNVFWTKAQLLTTRFTMNFIHAYSDREKLAVAQATAAALTAWWSSGALVPVVTDLVLAAWSMKEAITDVDDLFDGKRVPFIKRAGDWKTNIGVPAEGKPKTPEGHMWSYLDYLRVYLLLVPRELRLARINDLIEVNTKFAGRELKVRDLYCALRSDIEVSVNYLFMTAPFMPASLKTPQDRHILNAAAARDLY